MGNHFLGLVLFSTLCTSQVYREGRVHLMTHADDLPAVECIFDRNKVRTETSLTLNICKSYGLWCGRKLDWKGRRNALMFSEEIFPQPAEHDPTDADVDWYSDPDIQKMLANPGYFLDVCLTKCRCQYDLGDEAYPFDEYSENTPPMTVPSPIFPLELDFDDRRMPAKKLLPTIRDAIPHSPIWAGRLPVPAEGHNPDDYNTATFFFVGASKNRPHCAAQSLPPWIMTSLGRQYIPPQFDGPVTATKICLHKYFGGHNATTMGGWCTTQGSSTGRSHLHFPYVTRSPIFTDDVDIMWQHGPNLGNVLAEVCLGYCRCPGDGDYEEPSLKSLATLNHLMQGQRRSLDNMRAKSAYFQYQLNQCKAEEEDCERSDTCSDRGSACQCRAFEVERGMGSGLRRFAAKCIAGGALMMIDGRVSGMQTRGRLSARDVDEEHENFVACPCNSTYVSASCCEAPSGMVWEAADMKLGELKAL